MPLPRPQTGPSRQHIGHNTRSKGVDRLVQQIHDQLPTRPRGRRSTNPRGVLQDLIIRHPDHRELRRRPHTTQPHMRHDRAQHPQRHTLTEVHRPIRPQQRPRPRTLTQPEQPPQHPPRNIRIRPGSPPLLGLLTQRHHRHPSGTGHHTLPQRAFHHAAANTHPRPHRPHPRHTQHEQVIIPTPLNRFR